MPPGYIDRMNGPVLTWSTRSRLEECIHLGGYDTIKVVTGWGLVPEPGNPGGWTDANIAAVCNLTKNTVVRTVVGDGPHPSAPGFPYAEQVIAEVGRWYNAKPLNLFIEIGNEPNNNKPEDPPIPPTANGPMPDWGVRGVAGNPTAPTAAYDGYIWQWRWHLRRAIEECRRNFPGAKIVSPGMAPNPEPPHDMNHNPGRWYAIADQKFEDGKKLADLCDYIGFHVYADTAWNDTTIDGVGTNSLARTLEFMNQYYSDKQWVLSEYGINGYLPVGTDQNPDVPGSRDIKGRLNAGFIHYGQSWRTRDGATTPLPLPANVKMATYFHLCTNGPGPGESNDSHYSLFRKGDASYLNCKQNGVR